MNEVQGQTLFLILVDVETRASERWDRASSRGDALLHAPFLLWQRSRDLDC